MAFFYVLKLLLWTIKLHHNVKSMSCRRVTLLSRFEHFMTFLYIILWFIRVQTIENCHQIVFFYNNVCMYSNRRWLRASQYARIFTVIAKTDIVIKAVIHLHKNCRLPISYFMLMLKNTTGCKIFKPLQVTLK